MTKLTEEYVKKSRKAERVDSLEVEVAELRKRLDEFMEPYQIVEVKLTDEQTYEQIKHYVQSLKNSGYDSFADFDIMESLNIPIEQIDKALARLKKEGVIRGK